MLEIWWSYVNKWLFAPGPLKAPEISIFLYLHFYMDITSPRRYMDLSKKKRERVHIKLVFCFYLEYPFLLRSAWFLRKSWTVNHYTKQTNMSAPSQIISVGFNLKRNSADLKSYHENLKISAFWPPGKARWDKCRSEGQSRHKFMVNRV